jgi:hypothetical protein
MRKNQRCCPQCGYTVFDPIQAEERPDWVAASELQANSKSLQPLQQTGVELIAAERQRQVEVEGWTPEHDAGHAGESLAIAACCYALPPTMRRYHFDGAAPTLWPWSITAWKPTDDRVRELVKAGALIAAEIDRLQRAGGENGGG